MRKQMELMRASVCLVKRRGARRRVKHSTRRKVANPGGFHLEPQCDYSKRLTLEPSGGLSYLSNKRLIKSERESERRSGKK